MTKISKILTAAAALGVMGVAVLPAASYGAVDTKLQVVIDTVNGDNGGNNASGYKWFISDRDGGTTNLKINPDPTNAAGNSDQDGGASGGFSMIGTKVATSTGITDVNTYGFKAYYANVIGGGTISGTLASDTQNSLANATMYYGTDLLVGAGATGASAVATTSTPVALGTNAAGTLNVVVPSLVTADGSAGGGAGSWFKYDSSLPNGTYENTLTVTTIPNS